MEISAILSTIRLFIFNNKDLKIYIYQKFKSKFVIDTKI